MLKLKKYQHKINLSTLHQGMGHRSGQLYLLFYLDW